MPFIQFSADFSHCLPIIIENISRFFLFITINYSLYVINTFKGTRIKHVHVYTERELFLLSIASANKYYSFLCHFDDPDFTSGEEKSIKRSKKKRFLPQALCLPQGGIEMTVGTF